MGNGASNPSGALNTYLINKSIRMEHREEYNDLKNYLRLRCKEQINDLVSGVIEGEFNLDYNRAIHSDRSTFLNVNWNGNMWFHGFQTINCDSGICKKISIELCVILRKTRARAYESAGGELTSQVGWIEIGEFGTTYHFNGQQYGTMRDAEAARASMIGRVDGTPSTNVNGIVTQKKITGWNRDGKVTITEYVFNGSTYSTMREAEAARASMIGRVDGSPSTNVNGIVTQKKITGWTQAGKVTTTEYLFNGGTYSTMRDAEAARTSMIGTIDGSPSTNINGIITQKKITGWTQAGKVTTTEYLFNGGTYSTMRDAEAARTSMIGTIDGSPSTNVNGIVTQNRITGWNQNGRVTTTEYLFNGGTYSTMRDAEAAAEHIVVDRSIKDHVDEVIRRFDNIIEKDLSEESHIKLLINLNHELHKIADRVNEPAIVNRLLVTELRIARLRINQHLESGGHRNEVIQDLRSRIIELIEREIAVLRDFGIDVPGLKEKLRELEEALSVDNQSDDEIIPIEEEELKEMISEVEQLILKELFKNRHLQLNRDGNGLGLRDPQIALILESYTMDAMDKLLALRISSLEETEHKRVKVLKSLVIEGSKASDIGSIHSVSEQLVQLTSENEITLLPLIVTLGSNGDGTEVTSHWVGLIYEHNAKSEDIIVNYLDSESESPLRELIEKEPSTESRISFKQIPVEQQRYNNCGPELIENFIEYITGSRISQEEVIYVHSTLWEQSLILELLSDYKINQDYSEAILGEVVSIDIG